MLASERVDLKLRSAAARASPFYLNTTRPLTRTLLNFLPPEDRANTGDIYCSHQQDCTTWDATRAHRLELYRYSAWLIQLNQAHSTRKGEKDLDERSDHRLPFTVEVKLGSAFCAGDFFFGR